MTNIRKPKKYENIWTKTIAVLLLIALCIGSLGVRFKVFKMYDAGVFDSKDNYFKTSNALYHAQGYAIDIEKSYVNNPDSLASYLNQNFAFTIYQTDSDGVYQPVSSSEVKSDKFHTYKFYFNYETSEEDSGYTVRHNADDIVTVLIPEDKIPDNRIMIEMKVYDPPVLYDDIFKESYSEFTSLRKDFYKVLAAGIILLILIIFDLVFIISSAGYDINYDGIIMTVIDKMPYDLFSGVIILLAVFTLFAFEPFNFEENIGSAIVLIIMLIILGLYALTWLVSTVKRIKNRSLLKNTLTYFVGSFIFQMIVKLRLVWKTALFMCVYGILMMFLVYDNHLIPAIIISVFVCLYILWWLIKADEIKINTERIAQGSSEGKINTEYMPPALKDHAEDINSLHDGIKLAVDREMKSEHLKTELITNVSHDIKTPLTSIINYIDLLQKEHTDEEEEKYLEVLARQSDRLKKLIEDLIEASKASTGNVNVELTRVNVNEIISQSLSEYTEKMESARLDVIVNPSEKPLYVMADGNLLWRILNNLYNNIFKYAMPDTRVYIDIIEEPENVSIQIKNVSKEMLNIDADELMERFVRGDSSRHTEGSGLGLNIAGSLAEIMNGKLTLTIDGDLFKTNLVMPKA